VVSDAPVASPDQPQITMTVGGLTSLSKGKISTFAGTGPEQFSGDGGSALAASLGQTVGTVVDADGNVLFAALSANRIRKIDRKTGKISTYAGNGRHDCGRNDTISSPRGLAFDLQGNLLVTEQWCHRVRRINKNTGEITTVAGSTSSGFENNVNPLLAKFNSPLGLTVDTAGNLFIADVGNQRIRKVSTTGVVTTIAGSGAWGYSGDGGDATSAAFRGPNAVAVDQSGNVYVSDEGNLRVRRISSAGVISTVAGSGQCWGNQADPSIDPLQEPICHPSGLWMGSNGTLLIGELHGRRRILALDSTGRLTRLAGDSGMGLGPDGPANEASLGAIEGLTVASDTK